MYWGNKAHDAKISGARVNRHADRGVVTRSALPIDPSQASTLLRIRPGI